MLAIAAVIAFVIAIIMDLASLASGVLTVELFTLIGLACLAAHFAFSWHTARRG